MDKDRFDYLVSLYQRVQAIAGDKAEYSRSTVHTAAVRHAIENGETIKVLKSVTLSGHRYQSGDEVIIPINSRIGLLVDQGYFTTMENYAKNQQNFNARKTWSEITPFMNLAQMTRDVAERREKEIAIQEETLKRLKLELSSEKSNYKNAVERAITEIETALAKLEGASG